MRNYWLKYLMNDGADEVMTRGGVRLRRFINPALREMYPAFSKSRLVVERGAPLPVNRPLIFASTHAFKDDIPLALYAIDTPAYILFGNLSAFFNTFDGLSLWINGVVLVDRGNSKSRAGVVEKMLRVLELGSSVLIFPEATWNRSPNVSVQRLFPGVYDLASRSKALVVPLASIQARGNSYALIGEAFNLCEWDRVEGMKVLRDKLATLKWSLMEKHARGKRDDFGSAMEAAESWAAHLKSLIHSAGKHYDRVAEDKAQYKVKSSCRKVVFFIICMVLDSSDAHHTNYSLIKTSPSVPVQEYRNKVRMSISCIDYNNTGY